MSLDKDIVMKNASSDDDSDSDSSECNDDKIKELEDMLKSSPYHYESHIEIIKLLKLNGDLYKLRDARKAMGEIFPLTEEIWLNWIEDEKKLVTNNEERLKIYELFDKAVEDYLSVALWVEYCAYTVGDTSSEGGRMKARETYERALSSGIGLHCTRGKSIWSMYLDFEIAMFSVLQSSNDVTETGKKELQLQNDRISKLLKRQLSLPLEGIEKSLLAYEEWTGASLDKSMKSTYDKALKRSRQLFQFEVTLEKADLPRIAEHQAYIASELKDGQPSRIQLAFERAITDNPLDIDIWTQYTNYLDKTLKISSISLKVHLRSVRNCSWSSALWLSYCRAAERYSQSHTFVLDIYKRAFQMGFTTESDLLPLCSLYCDYLRRRISWHLEHEEQLEELRNGFELCHSYITVGDTNNDVTSSLSRYQAHIEAKYCKNIAKSRELWKQIMKEKHGNESEMWIEYFNLERAYGKHKNCMKILEDGVNSASDNPEMMFSAYINYSHIEGSLEEYEAALNRCESQQKRVDDRRVKAAEKENSSASQSKTKPNTKKKEFSKKNDKNTSNKSEEFKSPFPVKKQVFKAPPGFKPPPGFKAPPGFEFESAKDVNEDDTSLKRSSNSDNGEPPCKKIHDEELDDEKLSVAARRDRTVFVSNLDFKTSEQMLHSLFIKTGEIHEIRLVANIVGKSKGYAYVEFKDKSSVEKALLRDRETIGARPMFISICKDNKDEETNKEPIFKYSQEMEKNKLFIKGLPFSSTKESLQKLFSPIGEIRDIRLVTQRTGAFKGLAYIDYVDEKSASKAVMSLDGTEIGSHKISVAISNPPVRKVNVKVSSLGSGKTESHDRGRSHSMVSFKPRALGQKKKDSDLLPKQKMNNSEFRNLLLKK